MSSSDILKLGDYSFSKVKATGSLKFTFLFPCFELFVVTGAVIKNLVLIS